MLHVQNMTVISVILYHKLLTCKAKVVCFLKIWWIFNEALLNYLEAIIIGMKPTLMKERRFDGIHVDQGWNVCSPHSYIIKKVYLNFVIHIVDLVALIRCICSLLCFLICWMVFQQVKRLAAVVLNCNKFIQLIYFLIDWFHLSQVKSTDWFGNQPIEFRNSLTIRAVILERDVFWSFFSAKLFWKLVETLSFVIIQFAIVEDWSWINSWSLCLGLKLGESGLW